MFIIYMIHNSMFFSHTWPIQQKYIATKKYIYNLNKLLVTVGHIVFRRIPYVVSWGIKLIRYILTEILFLKNFYLIELDIYFPTSNLILGFHVRIWIIIWMKLIFLKKYHKNQLENINILCKPHKIQLAAIHGIKIMI